MVPTRKLKFKTELNQLMDIIIHSLYSHREVFLRELISNASDAIDKLRYETLTDRSLAGADTAWQIKLVPDKDAGTLTISDNGIGMDEETVIQELGTIARSGTKAFLERMKEGKHPSAPELIGQFGVGFYSAFMVAERVRVETLAAGEGKTAVCWESTGQGDFSVGTASREAHGTDIVLYLREDARQFLEGWELRSLVKRFSDFVEHPIVLVTTEEKDGKPETKEETVNSQKAIWLRSKDEIKDEDYASFYKHVSHDFADPLHTIHYSAEGALEFKALLFLPAQRPFDYYTTDPKPRVQLYVNRVFITDACENLLPQYLRFVKGVVDSSDLPLNVSREMLQDNPMVRKIESNLVKRILGALEDLKTKEYDKYLTFFKAFGATLKEGVARDYANREKLAGLLLFQSLRTDDGKYLTLDDYISQMPEDQKEIYYLCGERMGALRQSPYLEVFKDKGQDVLLLDEPVDPFFAESIGEYKGKHFKAVDHGALADAPAVDEAHTKAFEKLLKYLGDAIEEVKEVRLSSRLRESAACLVADEGQMSAQMERLMKQFGGETGEAPRILELNPDHEAVKAVLALFEKDKKSADVIELGRLLLDQAVIAEGSKIKDPAAFARRINLLIAQQGG
ncbi:MAG: molecular chaperone HtpG [Kiritimatiellia bacterium]